MATDTRSGSGYILDQSWEQEAERLRWLEAWCDPCTITHLKTVGVAAGWHCLEVGAGRGSIAAHLADLVGSAGRVHAVDLDLTLMERHQRPNVTLERLDILADPLPRRTYDLVHARNVIGHLGERRQEALSKLVTTLKPGGVLMIEDIDMVWNQVGEWPATDPELAGLLLRVWRALMEIWKLGGYDGTYARRIAAGMRDAGLQGVRGESRASIGGVEGAHLTRLSALRFREPLLGTGAVTRSEFDRFIEILERAGETATEDDVIVTAPLLTSVWGRRPA